MGGKVVVERDGTVATLTVSNPAKKNALNLKILGELRAALSALAAEDTRCVILRGEGTEAFCAGYDITQVPAGGSGEAQVFLPSNPFDDMIRGLESFPAPVIAMATTANGALWVAVSQSGPGPGCCLNACRRSVRCRRIRTTPASSCSL